MEVVGIMLDNFHRFQLFQAGFFCDFIFTVILVIFKVPYIGDVPYIPDLVPQVEEEPKDDIEGEERSNISQMDIAIDGGPADIYSNVARIDGCEKFFLPAQ